MRSRFNVILVLALAAVLALGAASARAATTIGPTTANLTQGTFNICVAMIDCTYFQELETTVTPEFTSPIDGVIVRWRIGSSTPGAVRLRIVRSAGSGTFVGAGSSVQETASGTEVDTFDTRLPIKAGDGIGVDNNTSAEIFTRPFVLGNDIGHFTPFLQDGGSPTAITGDTSVDFLQLNADVEPDADHDGFGDETQDSCPGATGSIEGCPRADLGLAMAAAHGSQSDQVSYTLTVKNGGPDPVPDALVTDTLPAGAGVVGASGPGGSCPGASSGKLTCSAGAIAAGASATVTIATTQKAGTATNSAAVSSAALTQAATIAPGAGDVDPANNSASTTVSVAGPALASARLSGSHLCLHRGCKPLTLTFTSSEPASVKLAFTRLTSGRKVHGKCVRQTKKNRHKPRCTRKSSAGSVTLSAHSGTNKLTFAGRLSSHKKLKPGRYTVTITATDAARNSSTKTVRTIKVAK